MNATTPRPKLHLVTPFRAYDSRFDRSCGAGRLQGGEQRVVGIAAAIDPGSGAVTAAGVVPTGTVSVVVRLTVTDTIGTGHLATGDAHAPAVDWAGVGQCRADHLIVPVDDRRRLRVAAVGDGATHLTIDIEGYHL